MQHEQRLHPTASVETHNRYWYFIGKRFFDLVLSIVLLLAIMPILLVIAIVIKLNSSGPVLFRQVRLGRDGRPFHFYKFRTMYQNADPEIHRRYVESLIRAELPEQRGGAVCKSYKLKHDPRITRVGHILRRTSLDEVPQFLNVIKGDMSLVGPRPPLPYEVQSYSEWHMNRLAAIPGITGLWQVRGRSRVSFDEMVRMDLEYIGQQSFWLDIKILLLTIPAVLSGAGAD
jgi:exopolysaccharide biosynthesis polyprenyl glycosylphosphotransferase